MIWIYMIITSLVTTALSKGSFKCILSYPTATTTKCLGELGEPLFFCLPAGTTKLTLKKNDDIVFKLIDRVDVLDNDKPVTKLSFFKNATLKLNKASKEDAGDYQLEIYNSANGKFLTELNLHVEIRAPVPKPAVSQTCLSPEQMKVSCSFERDGAEIILSLDNNVLIRSRNGTTGTHYVSLNLYGQLTGNLTCDVQHNVSREQTVIQLTSCSTSDFPGDNCFDSPVTMAVRASAAALLLFLSFFLFLCVKYLKSRRSVTVTYDVAEDEIDYSDKRGARHHFQQNVT